MELSVSDVTSVFIGVGTLLGAFAIWKKQHKQSGYPDGPFSFPILGNLPQIVLSGSLGSFLDSCKRHYGNIFTVEIGGTRRVAVFGYENIHKLLVKNADITSNRSSDSFPPVLRESAKINPGLLWAPFPHWKIIRIFSLTFMREEGMGKQALEPKILSEIDRFCDYFIDPRCGQTIDISRDLSKATNNMISELIFGGRNEYDDPHFEHLMRTVDKDFQAILKAGVFKNIPFMKYFKFSGLQDLNETSKILIPEMASWLQKHRADLDPDNPRDIFDAFLANQMKGGDESSTFTDGNGGILALQLYVAGTETTSTAVRMALQHSCFKDDVRSKVIEEIDREIGRERPVSSKDRVKLPYTEAVLLETLRLTNIADIPLPHTMDKPLEVDGVVIPAGADLMLNMASVLHDEEVFEDPLEFKPERYLSGDVTLKKQRTIPFGLGRRVCLGESLARMELFLFYVTLLQRYDITVLPKDPTKSAGLFSDIGIQLHLRDLIFKKRN